MRQIVLDTETTGLEWEAGHRIIEVACVELINRKFTGKHYHQYINPNRSIDEAALAVHGITNQFLDDKPVFNEIASPLMEFIQGAELIIHNAAFDLGFLNHEFSLLPKKCHPIEQYCRIIDTLLLARQLHVGQRNNLDALCKRYGIDNSHREFHGALLDAHLLAQVYLAMTGGQGSLFIEPQQPIKLETIEPVMTQTVQQAKAKNLVVLRASPEELALHEEKLQQLNGKNQCVWLVSAVETTQ